MDDNEYIRKVQEREPNGERYIEITEQNGFNIKQLHEQLKPFYLPEESAITKKKNLIVYKEGPIQLVLHFVSYNSFEFEAISIAGINCTKLTGSYGYPLEVDLFPVEGKIIVSLRNGNELLIEAFLRAKRDNIDGIEHFKTVGNGKFFEVKEKQIGKLEY